MASLSQLRSINPISHLYGMFILGLALLLAACGGPNAVSSGSTTPTTPQAASINVITSSAQLNSDGKTPVTVTVLVKDTNNAAMANQAVTLAVDSGVISAVNTTTDATGTVTATLNTSGDPTNRTITISAKVGSATGQATVVVSGSSVTVAGGTSIVLNSSTTLNLKVQNSSGGGVSNAKVTIKSSLGNALSANGQNGTGSLTATTDNLGLVAISVTGNHAGVDLLTIAAVGVQQQVTMTVSNQSFAFTSPAANTNIPINTDQNVSVTWQSSGQPVVGQTVVFTSSRGMFRISPTQLAQTVSAQTDSNGVATAKINSDGAGSAIVQASAIQAAGGSQQVSAVTTQNVAFVANSVARVDVQPDKTILQVFKPNNTGSVATLTAVVRDAKNNLVQGAEVDFSATDISGGSLSSPSSVTNSSGVATVTYTAGTVGGPQDGVVIVATVSNLNGIPLTNPSPVTTTTKLTVGAQALFLRMGASNTLVADSAASTYSQTVTVVVTDSAGNPIPQATVQFEWVPTTYSKGLYNVNGQGWFPVYSTTCPSEDVYGDGILRSGEDINGDGKLTPGNIASITNSAVTDSAGFATAQLKWPKQYSNWVTATVKATVQVGGTEGQAAITNFPLIGLVGDFNNPNNFPPAASKEITQNVLTTTAAATTTTYHVTPTAACTDNTQPYNFKATCLISDAGNWQKAGLDPNSAPPTTTTTTTSISSMSTIPVPSPNPDTYIQSDTTHECVLTNSSLGYCMTEVTVINSYALSTTTTVTPVSPFNIDGSCTDPN